eukprot:350874-Chlamydomonas_euryale.AAC.12
MLEWQRVRPLTCGASAFKHWSPRRKHVPGPLQYEITCFFRTCSVEVVCIAIDMTVGICKTLAMLLVDRQLGAHPEQICPGRCLRPRCSCLPSDALCCSRRRMNIPSMCVLFSLFVLCLVNPQICMLPAILSQVRTCGLFVGVACATTVEYARVATRGL